MDNVHSIRTWLRATPVKNGMIELLNVSFEADEPSFFGSPAEGKQKFFMSEDSYFNTKCSHAEFVKLDDSNGISDDHYAWRLLSNSNGLQYYQAISWLLRDKESRKATMYYNAQAHDGENPACCTGGQFIIRDNKLHYMVTYRSNDAVKAYANDWAWHNLVHRMALIDLHKSYPDLKLGTMYWNVGSFHIYQQDLEGII